MAPKNKLKAPGQVAAKSGKGKAGKDLELIPGTAPKPEDIVADPSTGATGKAKHLKVYRSMFTNLNLPLYIPNKRPGGEEVKVYAKFKENSYTTADKNLLKALDDYMAAEIAADIPLKQRRLLSEEEYLTLVSPERLYISYNNKQMHISRVREGLQYAEDHGWTPNYGEVHVIETKKGRVRSGAVSAGGAAAGN